MSSGTRLENDELVSGSKIDPLASKVKDESTKDTSGRGSAGTDTSIDQARIEPLGGHGQYQHPAPRDHDGGAAGTDETIQGSKIDPLAGKGGSTTDKSPGISDESVSGARIEPVGSVREEMQ